MTQRLSRRASRAPGPIRARFGGLGLALLLVAAALVRADEAPRSFGRDRSVDIEHVRIDAALDLVARSVTGATDLTVRALNDGTSRAKLMAKEFQVRRVLVDGREVKADYDGARILIPFDPPLLQDDRRVLRVEYSAHPQEGLYFVGSPRAPRTLECWSQGEQEENSAWFPVHDDPNERATSETLITVARPYAVVSNGPLLSVTDRPDGSRTFHHRMDFPHVPYLVSIAVGDWATTTGSWEGVELQYNVPKPLAADAGRTFARTPEILAFLSQETGVKYPYPVYRQTAVSEYIYGGMENIAATTLTTETLHPERAHVDRPSESLVAHEAAHQWFGDYVTCSDWSDTWLNEGFATYYAALSMQHLFGAEQWAVEIEGMRGGALGADGSSPRPVVWNRYRSTDEMFGGHSYSKGAMVLHALRRELGDEQYRKAVTAWLTEHAGQSANTHAFIATVERATGRDISKFADQWLFRAGAPKLAVSWTWEDGRCSVTIRQAQERSDLVGLFDIPLDLVLLGADGAPAAHEVRCTSAEQTWHFEAKERPKAVLVDPQGWLLGTVEPERGTPEKCFVLARAPFLLARMDAARALAEQAWQPDAFAALVAATRPDQPWPLRRAAAEALAKGGEPARDPLLALLRDDPDSRVRAAVARGLGRHEDARVAAALERALSSDASWEVQSAAASALGKMDLPGLDAPLERALRESSHRDVVFSGALSALKDRRSPRALPVALEWSRPGHSRRARAAAISTLGDIAAREPDERRRGRIRQHLESLLDERHVRLRSDIMNALAQTRDPAVRPLLEGVRSSSGNALTRSAARRALEALDRNIASASSMDAIRASLEDERREREKLEDRVRSLEARTAPSPEGKGEGAAD